MKILYHILYPNSTGADRWIYEGWRDAFLDLGHEFFELTAFDNLEDKIKKENPHIFMTAINLLDFRKDMSILKKMRQKGTKIFLWVHWPLVKHILPKLENAEPHILNNDVADIYFGEREPEGMGDFEQKTGKKYYIIPNAANKKLHFPTQVVNKYKYDIVYLGAKLPKKKWFFDKVLIPLTKKYKVGIFGPYWTIQDNVLCMATKFCKKFKSGQGMAFLNKFRIVIPKKEENQLYSSAKISINFHERESDGSQPHYILNQRTFKIPACGGFEICDWVPALRKYFKKDEMIMAKMDPKDWFQKIDYYLTHEKERKSIQKKGTERASRDHTYHNRVKHVIDLYNSL